MTGMTPNRFRGYEIIRTSHGNFSTSRFKNGVFESDSDGSSLSTKKIEFFSFIFFRMLRSMNYDLLHLNINVVCKIHENSLHDFMQSILKSSGQEITETENV